jgi:hypothetical protein
VNTKLGRDANWFSNLFFRVMGISPEKGARTLIYLAEEDKQNLVSGEYYAKMEVKKITKQSYDLMVAQKLLDTLEVYIKDYVATPSLIFETSIKKNAEAIPILHN